ncbi:MAG: DUF3857 domain-containing protein, partial [Bacteroidia bacterium]|nr:DUF3857 domain-containing protein [Bacteroidia bacterium]
DETFEARKVLKEGKKRFPDCTYLMLQLMRANSRDGNTTEASLYREEIKAKDPDGSVTLGWLFQEAIDIEDYDEAEKILAKIESLEGMSEDVIEKKINLAGKRDQTEVLLRLIDQGYAKYPNSANFVMMAYTVEDRVNKNTLKGQKILEKYLKTRYSSTIIRTLIDSYFKSGNSKFALKWYETLVENNPLATGYYSQLASLYFRMGQTTLAEKYLQECIKIAPYVGTYHSSLAANYRDNNQTQEAIDAFTKAISLNPYDYESREQLRTLTGEKNIFSYFEEMDIVKLFKSSSDGSEYPEESSMILLEEVQKVVYEGGGSEERHIILVKVFNSRGVDIWKEYNISLPGNQQGFVIKAEVLKANGSKVAAQNQRGYIVFSNLEPGDAIHLSYQVRDYYYGELAGHFWKQHFFNYFIPMKMSRFSLLAPADYQFKYEVANGSLEPNITGRVTNGGSLKLYTWTQENQPPLEDEPYMSPLVDVGTVLHLSSLPDWAYVRNWYANLARAKAKPNFEVDELMTELFAGKENLSERETVETIYDYIVNNIRYSSVPFLQSGLVPQKASRVVSSKLGDCKDVSTLFVAMCESRGIDANLVLINTRDNGLKDMVLPSINFNHCIAQVELEGNPYFVELTAENLPFASGTRSIKQAFALPIRYQGDNKIQAQIIDPTTRVHNEVKRKTEVSFEADLMKVKKVTHKTGVSAASMRDTYEGIGKESQLKELQEAVNAEFPNIKVTDVIFEDNLETNESALDYIYAYQVPSVFMNIGKLSIFRIPWSDNISSPDFLSTEERKYPIELWEYFQSEEYTETITFTIPEGKQLSELPEELSFDLPYLTYKMSFEQEGNRVVVSRHFELLQDIIQPEDFVQFKEVMGAIVKNDETRLAFE